MSFQTPIRPISDVLAGALAHNAGIGGLPQPIPPPVASAVRSVINAAECAALAGVAGEHFDAALVAAREAFRAKHNELVGVRQRADLAVET